MIVSSFVPAVLLKATGKVVAYNAADTKSIKVVALANVLIDDWAAEPGVDWQSLSLPDVSIGTVTAAQSFLLPATMRKISDQEGDVVRILHSDGVSFTDYDTIAQYRTKDYANGMRTFQDNYVSQVGSNLRFNRAFTATDPQFGGTIYVSGYGYATHIAGDNDVIPVDNPNWLVYATAAAYDSTDVTRQNLVPNLEAKANNIMDSMKEANDGQLSTLYSEFRPLGKSWS